MQIFKKEMKFRGHTITAVDNGVDNSGKVVKGKTSCAADFAVELDGTPMLLEVENSFVSHKCTFKVYHLQQYVKAGACILLFYNTGNINYDLSKMEYDEALWAIIDPEMIAKMLEDKKDEYYNEPLFGGKTCLRILEHEYEQYFTANKVTYHRG
jgi:hypothetical protein